MTLTLGLCGAAVLIVAGYAAYRFLTAPTVDVVPAVIRVPRKNKPLRKPTRSHLGRRAERP